MAIALHAQMFTALCNFDGADGALPSVALMQVADCDLYVTTGGGAKDLGAAFNNLPASSANVIHR